MEAPDLKGMNSRELYLEAVEIVKALSGTADQKADLFEELSKQINKKTSGSWEAKRAKGTDGAHVFWGSIGQVLVISLDKQLWQGSFQKGGIRPTPVNKEIRYEVDYTKLRKL